MSEAKRTHEGVPLGHAVSLLDPGVDPGDLPQHIYKYRCWTDPLHKRLVTDNELYFASARDFNDPFDSTVSLDYGSRSDSEHFAIMRKHVEADNPGLTEDQIDSLTRTAYEKGLFRDESHTKRTDESWLKYIYEKFGICTLSELRDNILLWSHYADSHKGFCVGLNVIKLHEFMRSHFNRTGELLDHLRVIYFGDYPNYNPLEIDSNVSAPLCLATKAGDWRYEREHRLVLIDHIKPVRLDEGIIDEVIMGCRMTPQNCTDIMRALRSSGFRGELWRAETKKGDFRLYFSPVSYRY